MPALRGPERRDTGVHPGRRAWGCHGQRPRRTGSCRRCYEQPHSLGTLSKELPLVSEDRQSFIEQSLSSLMVLLGPLPDSPGGKQARLLCASLCRPRSGVGAPSPSVRRWSENAEYTRERLSANKSRHTPSCCYGARCTSSKRRCRLKVQVLCDALSSCPPKVHGWTPSPPGWWCGEVGPSGGDEVRRWSSCRESVSF